MAATTTAQLSSIWQRVRRDHPELTFVEGDVARWSPFESTVYYAHINGFEAYAHALHELGHAICEHTDFTQDIELLRMEREAWQAATELGLHFGAPIGTDLIETALDTYREWLHARSRCPNCNGVGLQGKNDTTYRCVLCRAAWRANDARQCELRRYTTQKTRP